MTTIPDPSDKQDLDDEEGPSVSVVGAEEYAKVPEALLYDPTLSPLAKAVYGVLRRHGDVPARCYPSHKRIGSLLGVSERSVQRPVVDLERAGWVVRVRRIIEGRERSCGYIVHAAPRAQGRGARAQEREPLAREGASPGRAQERDEREPLNESQGTRKASAPTAPARALPLDDVETDQTPPLVALARGTDMTGFDAFWDAYPKRNGKRVGRRACEVLWGKLNLPDRRAAWRGARHYADAVRADLTIAKDPERFLRHRVWEDWQEPASPETVRAGRRASTVEESWRNIIDGPTEGIR